MLIILLPCSVWGRKKSCDEALASVFHTVGNKQRGHRLPPASTRSLLFSPPWPTSKEVGAIIRESVAFLHHKSFPGFPDVLLTWVRLWFINQQTHWTVFWYFSAYGLIFRDAWKMVPLDCLESIVPSTQGFQSVGLRQAEKSQQ